jgi:hypothetical protein
MFFLGCTKDKSNADRSNQDKSSAAGGDKASMNENKDASTPPNNSSSEPKNPTSNSDKFESIYTEIAAAKCETIESNEDEEWIVQECPGVGGYKLEVSEGDLRQTIDVISPAGKKSELNFSGIVSSGFSALGEKAEWRVKKVGEKVTPVALIARYNVSEDPDKPEKTTSYLVVSKISGETSCVIEIIKPVSDANEKTRVSADNSGDKACLTAK